MLHSTTVEQFFDAIGTVAQSKIDKVNKDVTIDAEIFSILNVENGEYRVKYQGNTFNAYCFDPTIVFNLGDRVYVLVPQGDYSNKKMILGHSEYNNTGYKDEVVSKNFYVDKGSNWLDNYPLYEPMKICACPEEKESLLTDEANYADYGYVEGMVPNKIVAKFPNRNYPTITDETTVGAMREADQDLARQAQNYKHIKIQADFRTEFMGPHEEGEYSLQVTCLQKNPQYKGSYEDLGDAAQEWLNYQEYIDAILERQVSISQSQVEGNEGVAPYIPITFELSFSNFSGASPYGFSSPATQKAYFNIENIGLAGLYSIALVQNGKFKSDVQYIYNADGTGGYDESTANFSRNNIFCDNVQIYFCEQVNLYNTLYYPWLSLPYGDALYGLSSSGRERNSIDLVAHFQYKQLDLTSNANCRVIWFRQKADVIASSYKDKDKDEFGHSWFEYGGPGWYPIQKMIDESPVDETLYKINGNTLTIYKDAVPHSYNYKAVMVYYEPQTSGDSTYYREISRGSVTQKVIRKDSIYNLEIEDFEYKGVRYLRIKDNNTDVNFDEWLKAKDELAAAEEELAQAEYEKNETRIQIARLRISRAELKIMDVLHSEWRGTWFVKLQDDSYNQISEKQWQGPIDIGRFCQDACEFYVMAYDPAQFGGGYADPTETAVLEYFILPPERSQMVIDWQGQSDFNYDALGGVRNDVSMTEYVLTPVLRFAQGAGAHYGMTIVAPDGITELGSVMYSDQIGASGFNLGSSMMKDMYIDQNYGIHFHIKPTYDPAATDNTFKVVVTLVNGITFSVDKTVSFSKDGEQGTIGNEWKAQILPTNWKADSKELLYTSQIVNTPSPLVVEPINTTTDPQARRYRQNPQYRLFLRPFVTRNGIPLEQIDKQEAYFYKCSWDVRLPSAATIEQTKRSSFLRLYHASRYDPTTDVPTQGAIFDCTPDSEHPPKYWEMDGLVVGGGDADIKVNPNEQEPRGLVGFTIYPSSPYYSKDTWFQNTDNECYGAVEVGYFDNFGDGTRSTLEMNQYHFIVKCQIDVFQGGYDVLTKQIRTEGHIKRVASIISYYPVDVFFNEGKLDVVTGDFAHFEQRIATNWPKFVYYTASGDYPETMAEPLYFKFGGFLQNEPVNYKPRNLSGQTQSIQEQARIKEGVIDHYDWLYQPNPHLDPISGYHGALCTGAEDGPFKGGWYLRNQVMISNLYGNVDINAWDGQGLDTNDKEGTIFGSVFGAGYKNPVNNQFTGVLMGADKAQPRKDIQGNRTGYTSEEDEYRPYMTGLFGYQDGHQSFGLMENGTAFFGRADRGGRIIIDGSNALIYGGANGIINTPQITDPMWNTMRLNLIDLTHATTDPKKDADTWYTHDQQDQKHDLEGKEISPTYIGVKNGDQEQMILGFDGDFYTYSNEFDIKTLPKWYKILWSNAYIKPDRSLPYWLIDKKDPDAPGGVRKQKAGPWHDGQGFKPEEGDVGIWNGIMPKAGGDNLRVNYFEKQWIGLPNPDDPTSTIYYNWEQIDGDEDKKEQYKELLDSGKTFSRSSFGPNRASTTPAIEIGQHIHGLMPGLIPYDQYEEVFTSLAIPGDRNFMVTYDGTLWAMNGIFMGAIIGSNIVGGRIQGAELAMGDSESVSKTKEIRTLWGIDARYLCDWSSLSPPRDATTPLSDIPVFDSGRAFNVNSDGYIGANSLILTGGSIDIGGFHLIGKETLEFLGLDTGANKSEIGHLIQNGKSDFVGLTHFYGNVGIAPALDSKVSQSNTGAFTQTGGITVLGGILDDGKTINHQYIDNFAFKRVNKYYAGTNKQTTKEIGRGGSLEQSAIFAINTRNQLNSKEGIQSHLWPLHFRAFTDKDGKVQSYVTIMNQFKNWEKISSPPKPAFPFNVSGSNYFRIGQWGAEVMTMFIRSSFQLEEQSKIPTYDTNNIEDQCRGYFGSVNRAGYGDSAPTLNGAIGLTSWSRNAILCNSDDSIGFKARTINVFQGGYRGAKYNDSSSATVTEEEDFQPMKSYTANLFIGNATESSGPPNGQISAYTAGGYVSLGTYRNTDFGNIKFNGNYMSQSTALYMKSDNESGLGDKNSVYMFATGEEDENSRSGVHIFCRPASDTFQGCFWALTPELFLNPHYAILSGKKGVGIQAFNNGDGNEAHKMGNKGLYITEDGTKLQVKGFEPEFQEGIYARFA